MGISNLVSLFAPTLMTVDDDPVSYLNSQYEFTVITKMIKYYKWLFQVDENEEMKEVVRLDGVCLQVLWYLTSPALPPPRPLKMLSKKLRMQKDSKRPDP